MTKIDWSLFIKRIAASVFLFTFTTFCMGLFVMLNGIHLEWTFVLMLIAYLYVFFFAIRHVIQILPMPGIMIFTPIAPLVVLIIVVSMIPLLEWLLA